MKGSIFLRFSFALVFFIPCTMVQSHATLHPSARPVSKETIGKVDDKETYMYSLVNKNNIEAKIMTYGAILFSLEVPDRNGNSQDITLGYATLDEYIQNRKYFGATIGRYGNRIAKGKFTLNGTEYTLATNNGPNHLHGGMKGFNKVVWESEIIRNANELGVRLHYLSKDGEEGYPGNLNVTIIYTLNNENELKIEYKAVTDRPTPVNLTHHSFWNLSGDKQRNILEHELMINADYYLPVDDTLIPTGEIRSVIRTPMDFTKPMMIGSRIDAIEGGYDHCYVLNDRSDDKDLLLAARVFEPENGRGMEIYTTEPGIQFYSGNFFDGSTVGKSGKIYNKYDAFCLETQHFPDSPNRAYFPSVVLKPGETYHHICVHKFYTN